MVLYPTFFTPLEDILMNQNQIVEKLNTTQNVTGSTNINMGISKKFGGWYANFCYLLLVFMLLAGFIDILAYGFHNSGNLNTDKDMNLGVTSTQLTFGLIICILSIMLVYWHVTTNSTSYVEKIQLQLGSANLKLSTLGQFKTPSNASGRFVPSILMFPISLFVLAFVYGITIVIFTSDRMLCTTSGSCSITKFTTAEQNALEI